MHGRKIGRIPGADDQPARKGIAFDFREHVGELIDDAAVRSLPRAPLLAVDGPEIALGVGPFVPNADAMLFEIGNIGIAAQKP